MIDHSDHLQDFYDTACVVSQLDPVISVDTAVTHLAGALDVPVWTCSNTIQISDGCADVVILRKTINDSDPSKSLGDWDSVLDQIQTNLVRLLALPQLR